MSPPAPEVSILKTLRTGDRKWDVYLRIVHAGSSYIIYMPMLPREPRSAEAFFSSDRSRIVIRVSDERGGMCSCELDPKNLEKGCSRISCSPGSVWISDENILRDHVAN